MRVFLAPTHTLEGLYVTRIAKDVFGTHTLTYFACGKLQGDLAHTLRGIVRYVSLVTLHTRKRTMLCEV